MLIKDRPLSDSDKNRLHPEERRVVEHYEWVTERSFNRLELKYLKICIKTAYPEQVNQAISFLYRKYPQNFTTFSYIVPYVQKVFKNKKGDNENGETKNSKKKTRK